MDRMGFIFCTARKLPGGGSLRVGLSSCLILLTVLSDLQAEGSAPGRASSSQQSRQEVLRLIPFDQLSSIKRSKIERVVSKPSVYRRLPIQLAAVDPQLFTFLVRYPEVVIEMWQLMGATQIQFKRTGIYSFHLNDGAGTSSHVELVYGTPDLHIFYAEGFYDGSLTPRRLRGRCVMVLTTGSSQQQGGTFLSSRLDVFLQVDQLGVELLARTLHPLLGGTVDKNYADTIRFVGQLSRASARNRAGMERLIARLTDIDPAIRHRFTRITAQIIGTEKTPAEHVARPVLSVPSSLRGARANGPSR